MSKRIALVTGGTGGIGSCICRQLAADGFTVVANYIAPEEEKAQAWLWLNVPQAVICTLLWVMCQIMNHAWQ